ncbi:MAG: hypothetical protein ACK47B_09085 [Armatimonadota bacterium]
MLIAVSTAAAGAPALSSVLDLEPVLQFARACAPDAVCLLPPIGPDDQPNAAGLLAMKDRLEDAGLGVLGGRRELVLEEEGDAEVLLFETRILLTALGEAEVSPLFLAFSGPAATPEVISRFLERLRDEAARARVRVVVECPSGMSLPNPEVDGGEWVSPCMLLDGLPALQQLEEGDKPMVAARIRATAVCSPDGARNGVEPLRKLIETPDSVLLVDGTAVEAACAVGYLRGLAAGAG